MKFIYLTCLFFLLGSAQAQTIYKTVDEDGNISYTSTKPDDSSQAKIIAPPREPTQHEIDAAQQRQTDLEASLKKSRKKRELQELENTLEQRTTKQKREDNKAKNTKSPGLLF